MANTTKTKRVVLVSTDKLFAQDVRAAFAQSETIQLVTVERTLAELRGEIQELGCSAVIVDMDAARLEEIEALQRITRRLEGRTPCGKKPPEPRSNSTPKAIRRMSHACV